MLAAGRLVPAEADLRLSGCELRRALDRHHVAVFGVASFWWLNARKGSIETTRPRAYAFGGSGERLRLRFPFSFFNTGAQALIVGDLRSCSWASRDAPNCAGLDTGSAAP